MASNLEALKQKKAMLLKKAGMKSANIEKIRQREAEERKLKAEIYALEHPGSSRARDKISSASRSFGSIIKRNAKLVANNAVRIQKEKGEKAKKERIEERKLEMVKLRSRKGKKSVNKVSVRKGQSKKSKLIDYGW
jgi:wyosine [tRNA(Phe)-imidazoG37] synthetase (radical SAM superfamily)